MTLVEEANKLCEEICATAPKSILEGVDGNKWMAALLVSREYWKVNATPPTIESAKSVMAASIKQLFLGGLAPQYICQVFSIPTSDVVNMLVKAGIPAVVSNKPITIDLINEVVQTDDQRIERCEQYVKSIKSLAERLQYTPIEPTCDAQPEKNVVMLMAFDGYSAGDIACYTNSEVKDILQMLHSDLGDKEAREDQDVIEDWMCGKSIMFMALKYSTDRDEIKEILKYSGYVTSGDPEYNITALNKYMAAEGFTGDLRRGCFTGTWPGRPYLTTAPKMTNGDDVVLRRMLAQGYPTPKLATTVGMELPDMVAYIKERGLR